MIMYILLWVMWVTLALQSRVVEANAREQGGVRHLSDIDKKLIALLKSSSAGRKKVMNMLVNEYTSGRMPDPADLGSREDDTSDYDADRDDWSSHLLDKAFEAIDLSEDDGEPAQIKGHDFLYVGSVGASRNEDFLRRHNITHVVNWSTSAKCNVFDGIEYLCTAVKGSSGMKRHMEQLERAVEYVESVRTSGGRVLSHCWYGENRSVTLVVAYLMRYEGMGAHEATHLVQKTRPHAKPYWDVLQVYSDHLETLSRK